jgi:hypothetical protein
MRRTAKVVIMALLSAGIVPFGNAAPADSVIDVIGKVSTSSRPIGDALVIAFNLSGYQSRQTFTIHDGTFKLPALPLGIYRLIAVKQGFAPAVTTITRKNHGQAIAIHLRDREHLSREERDEIWSIRQSLPADILREIEIYYEEPVLTADTPRFRGEIGSVAGVSETEAGSFAKTTLGVSGPLGGNWSVALQGRTQRFANDVASTIDNAWMESSGVDLELRSDTAGAIRLASSRNQILTPQASSTRGGVEWHRFAWTGESSNVEVKYLTHENYAPFGAAARQTFELAGNTYLFKGERSDLNLSLYVGQDLPAAGRADLSELRTADISTTGRLMVHPMFVVRYGMQSRTNRNGSSLSPTAGGELRLNDSSALVLLATQKVTRAPEISPAYVPMLVSLQGDRLDPRYRYSVAFVSDGGKRGRLEITARQIAIDETARVILTDLEEPFFDGFDLADGEVQRDMSVSWSRSFADLFALNLTSTIGESRPEGDSDEHVGYVLGSLRTYVPALGTTLDLTYRQLSPSRSSTRAEEIERMYFRVGQPVPLPLDMKLLVGLDLARSAHLARERRVIGGLSVAF